MRLGLVYTLMHPVLFFPNLLEPAFQEEFILTSRKTYTSSAVMAKCSRPRLDCTVFTLITIIN